MTPMILTKIPAGADDAFVPRACADDALFPVPVPMMPHSPCLCTYVSMLLCCPCALQRASAYSRRLPQHVQRHLQPRQRHAGQRLQPPQQLPQHRPACQGSAWRAAQPQPQC